MAWANGHVARLRQGKTAQFRPRGQSMQGKIESGQLVTVEPVTSPDQVQISDIVLCKVHGTQYLHLIKDIKNGLYQIGNNKGHINGWITFNHIYGKCVKVED